MWRWERATALGKPAVPEEHRTTAIWSPPVAREAGLKDI